VMVEQPVSLVDLFPTLIELCGLPKETRLSTQGVPLDGYSLVPFLKNADNAKWSGPAAALTAIHKWNDPDPAKQSYSLRSKDWRYIRYHNGDEELYHNAADRYEWTNLSAKPEYASVVTAFRQEMDQRVYQTFAAQADPSTALKVEASAAVSKDAGEAWKDKYFKNHPDADANRDGTLTWPEYKKHKSALDSQS
jgi:arylsulfatase A-like enzyme